MQYLLWGLYAILSKGVKLKDPEGENRISEYTLMRQFFITIIYILIF